MAAVTAQLGVSAIRDPPTIGMGLAATLALLSGRIPSALLVAAGGAVGVAASVAGIGP